MQQQQQQQIISPVRKQVPPAPPINFEFYDVLDFVLYVGFMDSNLDSLVGVDLESNLFRGSNFCCLDVTCGPSSSLINYLSLNFIKII